MSETFRAWTYWPCGVPDPGYIPPQPEPVEPRAQEIIHHLSNMSRADWDLLHQTAGQIKHLQKQVDELKARRKPKAEPKIPPKTYTYE